MIAQVKDIAEYEDQCAYKPALACMSFMLETHTLERHS